MRPEWKDFVGGKWESEINVRDFIQKNFTPYDGDESFFFLYLEPITFIMMPSVIAIRQFKCVNFVKI